jgi:hypothetical protein
MLYSRNRFPGRGLLAGRGLHCPIALMTGRSSAIAVRDKPDGVDRMRQPIKTTAFAVCFLAGTASLVFAQGSITQDPGRMTPGNLTTQQLGPSVGEPSSGRAGSGGGTTVFHGTSGVGNTSGTAPGYGASPQDMGAGSGAGFGGSATGGDLSRGIGPGR